MVPPRRSRRRRRPQRRAGRRSPRGESTLILAPTGTGKTLAAFLWCLDRLMFAPAPERDARCRVLYVSPLKALAVDVERNLRAPLAGIAHVAAAQRRAVPRRPAIAMRTGDTPAAERARFQRDPADILITTPESLYLLLDLERRASRLRGGRHGDRRRDPRARPDQARRAPGAVARAAGAARRAAAAAHRAVGDAATARREWRASSAAPSPRRRARRGAGPRRAGPVDARCTASSPTPPPPATAPVTDRRRARAARSSTSRVEVPVEDMAKVGQPVEQSERPGGAGRRRVQSIWTAIHPRLLELVRAHRSTLIFVNSRRLAERLAGALNELAGEALVRAHHGSLARGAADRDRGPAQGRPAARRWWPPRRSSWASTWAPSTWWCRSRRRRRSPAACSASAAPATTSARPARASSSRSSAATCWPAPRSPAR